MTYSGAYATALLRVLRRYEGIISSFVMNDPAGTDHLLLTGFHKARFPFEPAVAWQQQPWGESSTGEGNEQDEKRAKMTN